MKKQRKHGFKNFKEAIARDCEPGHCPVNACVVYTEQNGFAVKSGLSLPDDCCVAISNYEPYGTGTMT